MSTGLLLGWDGQVLKLIVAMVLQPYEYTENIELCTQHGGILQYGNFIPTKQFFYKRKKRAGFGAPAWSSRPCVGRGGQLETWI